MRYASLFSGIGGFEVGVGESFDLILQNDNAFEAQQVLKDKFPEVRIHSDISDLAADDIVGAAMFVGGFPCQDVSIVGGQKGMGGTRTVLVEHIFRLAGEVKPDWIFLENVQSIRFVHEGRALLYLMNECERLGYRWAYRTLDSRAFGVAQRRRRFYFLASKVADPGEVLFADAGPPLVNRVSSLDEPIGFYWTEGRAGHGLTNDAIPTLKAGSTIGIASPPAVLFPDGMVRLPTIETAEQLQGFPKGWTQAAPQRIRWKLVGNAVSPPVIQWIASRLKDPRPYKAEMTVFPEKAMWPLAATGSVTNGRKTVIISETPEDIRLGRLSEHAYEWSVISARALGGFVKRARESRLQYPMGFLDCLESALRALR